MTASMASAAHLRDRLVAGIEALGYLRTDRVREVMRKVPRHDFLPDTSVEDAYADREVITKPGPGLLAASCASVPRIVAMMLEQLDAQPGERILEVGAGTGYNAALLAELVGEAGHVSTIDVDPEVTAHARQALDTNGYGRVNVITADGAHGDPDNAPFDRIIVTVGPWDIPPAWFQQLAPGGRLVVPLRWRGQARSVPFTYDGTKLSADSTQLCGFIPMVGDNQDGEHSGAIDDDGQVTLYWDEDQSIRPQELAPYLDRPGPTQWTAVTIGPQDPIDGLWLQLTAMETGICRIAAGPAAISSGLIKPVIPGRTPAVVAGNNTGFAYLTARKVEPTDPDQDPRWELGATGHGPAGSALAQHLSWKVRIWDQDRTRQPTITAYPTPVRQTALRPGPVIRKHSTWLVLS
jgi:protein-L-isoaspartate(D-aspartate) O-methyltransferase